MGKFATQQCRRSRRAKSSARFTAGVRHVKTTVLPTTPQELQDALCQVFPDFKPQWDDNEPLTYHALLLEFTPHFGKAASTYSERQLRAFGDIVNRSIASGGTLENAVSTCFLEHMHQINVRKVLGPYLSREAKAKSHA